MAIGQYVASRSNEESVSVIGKCANIELAGEILKMARAKASIISWLAHQPGQCLRRSIEMKYLMKAKLWRQPSRLSASRLK